MSSKNLKNCLIYLIAPSLSLLIFCLFSQIWKLDLHAPFSYTHDSLVALFLVKIFIDGGDFFSSNLVGLPHLTQKFYLYDFPLNADSFNFLILKFLSFFSGDFFLVLNSFFILTFALISFVAFIVLRTFKISIFVAVIISVLFSFLPYHFYRGTWHLFLSNYSVIPLSIMVSLWIAADKIQLININQKQQYCLRPNSFFLIAFFISLFLATNGIYYALYSCVIFVFSWFLLALKNGELRNRNIFVVAALCLAIILTLAALYLPSFNYWSHSGTNEYAIRRNVQQSETFALRLVNLFLPIKNHYLDYFSRIRIAFNEAVYGGEGNITSLGLIGSTGFLFLFLWLITKSQVVGEESFFNKTIQKFSLNKNDENLISNLAGLNFLIVLFSIVGGLVMLLAVSFSALRAHARFAIFIGFLALFLMAIIFDKIAQKKKISAYIFLSVIFILGIFDQIGKVSAQTIQTQEMKIKFASDHDFVQRIEQSLPENSAVFQLPIIYFPEADNYDLLVGYLNSKNLRWSYPAVDGREAFSWQKNVIKLDFTQFISALKEAGFSGIYIDRIMMSESEKDGWKNLRKFEAKLKKISKKPAIVSRNLQLVFFEI